MSLVSKVGLFTTVLVVLTVLNTSTGQNDYQQAGLREHNKFRKLHGARALSLDSNLNAIAIKCANYYANKGRNDHSCPFKKKNQHGENLYWSSNSRGVNTKTGVVNAVNSWYNEVKKYNYNRPGFKSGTGHFTQLVWKASTRLGIGAAIRGNKVFVAAIYSPAGNFANQFTSNVQRKG